MKKIYLIVAIVLLVMVSINYVYFIKYEKSQIEYEKRIISEQTNLIGANIENIISNYENDLTKILFKNYQSFPVIFTNTQVLDKVANDLKSFYSKYRDLISNIAVYDNQNNYLGIYVKDNDEIVLDTFPRQGLNLLQKKDKIIKRKGYYISYFPFFKNNELYGNVEIEINLDNYLKSNLNLFRIKDLDWQWIADNTGKVIFTNANDSIKINQVKEIADAILEEKEIVLEHSYSLPGGEKKSILSAVYPLSILNNDLGMVFSVETSELRDIFINKNVNLLIITSLIVFLLILFLIYSIYNFKRIKTEKVSELISLKMIIEQFPVGIMIQDALNKIKYINRTGQKMLFINEDEEIIGKTLANQFLISNKYLLKDGFNFLFDSDHFIHYEKDGNEIVIYRRDINAQIAGEELLLSALIDVSALEKSRKQEAAANMAKSDFLAKMSHEIRTPMNGIIGMIDSLLRSDLKEQEKEQIQIIKRSSNLLLNIMNDILDFSKIEAGRMMLEEIPFNLSDELNISLELFKPLADAKGLEIITKVKPDVPNQLIGDPFRLRQVISNLFNNAIKFTEKGQIIIEVSLVEKYNSVVNLLFTIADTGIGISKENLKKIFVNYEQGKSSISREYGGIGLGTSIAKQLVEMMNGEIWVESPSELSADPNCPGTKFNFSIEVHSNERLTKKYDYSSITHYERISVLIINKIKDKQDSVHNFLDHLGININYRTYDDSNIDSIIYNLEHKKDIYQLIIIMDQPLYDGFAMAQQIKESQVSDYFPIIMVSSNDKPGNYIKCRTLGIDFYLIQPFESNELYKIIRSTFPGLEEANDLNKIVNKIRSDIKILVAEDNIINQRVTQNIFKHLAFEIDLAKNGLEVLQMMSEKKYDIVFMDILMPEMDGIAATIEIRKKYGAALPVIAITADNDKLYKNEASGAGMNDYITKPLKVETIKEILIKWFSESIK